MAECKQKERKIGHSFFLFQKHPSKIILTTNPQRRDKAYKKKTDNQPQTVQSAVQRGYTHTSNNKGHNCATSSPKKKKRRQREKKNNQSIIIIKLSSSFCSFFSPRHGVAVVDDLGRTLVRVHVLCRRLTLLSHQYSGGQ